MKWAGGTDGTADMVCYFFRKALDLAGGQAPLRWLGRQCGSEAERTYPTLVSCPLDLHVDLFDSGSGGRS